jgi:polar amino acid transport system substrate-binding protein
MDENASANAPELFLFFTALLLSVNLLTVDSDRELIIFTEEFPPYNFTKDESITGINVELVTAACKSANIRCTFQMYPWKRAFRMAQQTPNSGLVSTARSPERERLFKWVGPFVRSQNCIFKLASRDDIIINEQTPVSNYSMGASTDGVYEEVLAKLGFREGVNLTLYYGKFNKLKPFAAGRVDLMIGSAIAIDSQLKVANLSLKDVLPISIIDLGEKLQGNFLALHPNTNQSIVDDLQEALDNIKASEQATQIEQLFVKSIETDVPVNADPTLWRTCIKELR